MSAGEGVDDPHPPGPYAVVEGPLGVTDLLAVVRTVLDGHGPASVRPELTVHGPGRYTVRVDGARLDVRSSPLSDQPPGTLDPVVAGPGTHRIVLTASGAPSERAHDLFTALAAAVDRRAQCYTEAEAAAIVAGMPLLDRYARPEPALSRWALVFRDHYVENSVGFLLAMERAGLAPEWIFALSKGDRTQHRERVHSWFLHRGYASDVLDNSVINGTAGAAETAHARAVDAQVADFVRRAHAAGRKVLVIDDGGLLAQGYGADGPGPRVDAAVELTVSGLKRIAAAPGELAIPVLNMARSRLKSRLGYNEIADSCVRRLRAIVPGQKFIGRHVLLLGYGTLGARAARSLRALGCRVAVVDTDVLALITAAEDGFETHRTIAEALARQRPFLILGSSGDTAVTAEDVPLLPDGVLLAGFATKDFSVLTDGYPGATALRIPHVGVRYDLPHATSVTVLGDGRSLNLFEYEGIANRGYDAYRAGTLLAALALCRDIGRFPPGVHLEPVDRIIDEAGLFDAYYSQYLCARTAPLGTGAFSRADAIDRETAHAR
ncbi:hypothetical protein [Streptomyces mobaraensis]|uniref:S-adenosyl-L-homocysteine hydrolase NAD binding domain-containing protein n=1 Tax=Streptomyces mobaraensis (strain ATCC 29032 / DSM 40847 / JCM 4168 / NBRC 13819 / NCIMB 11159 / IPCR 16-22) TaxID=1223523 RepID=M3B5G1_STRM1|nr:hypothetical protein [Streptomyces mobaraensis]EMF01238.1 hypothetical protein H340_07276 [Streptomyces mobaraensis NBRC 13819 = DSM 40847]